MIQPTKGSPSHLCFQMHHSTVLQRVAKDNAKRNYIETEGETAEGCWQNLPGTTMSIPKQLHDHLLWPLTKL